MILTLISYAGAKGVRAVNHRQLKQAACPCHSPTRIGARDVRPVDSGPYKVEPCTRICRNGGF